MFKHLKENTFYKSTFILLVGGIFGKLIGFILKIIITRRLGTEGMGLYSLLTPTNALITTISVFSYSNAISKLVAEQKYDNKSLFISIIPISIILNIFFILIVYLISKPLSISLKNYSLYLPIICLSLTMPFISISAIIKGYFWGKQNMFPYILSNFIEQIIRLLLIVFFITKINNIIYSICFIILIDIIGEISSWIVMINYTPKIKLKIHDLKINKQIIKDIMSFTIPTTLSKIIGSISYFAEPIILTSTLLYVGYTNDYIVYEYGIINAYSLSTLLLPQFFTQNMSTSLIPELSKQYKLNNYSLCIKRIKQIVLLSSLIGTISTLIITIFPKPILFILYNTNEGIDYIRLLSPFTILFYIEYPLINALQALGKTKLIMNITIKTSFIRIISLIVFSLLKIGMYSLVITIIINLITSTYLYYKNIKKILII